jgi:UDP-3-O-[3-hydroxymyristoyl] glucosamine N-acyltransferase
MQITVQHIAALVQGEIIGNPETIILGPGKIEDGKPGMITFLANDKYESFIYDSKAAAVLVSRSFRPSRDVKPVLIKVDNVYASLAALLSHFDVALSSDAGISHTAVIDRQAEIGQNVSIGHHSIVRKNARIGDNTIVHGQVFIGDDVRIGKNVKIYPGVKIYHGCIIGDNCTIHANSVVGSDGFGFAHDNDGKYSKIPQIGNVVIENDVEIGANTVIDRATMGSTIIRSGVKLDNLIQVAHNVEIGKDTVIAALAGISGSVKIGERCMIGGQVGFAGHIHIADGTMIAAQTGILSSITEKDSKIAGTPAIDYGNYLKSYAYFRKLPDLAHQIRMLEKELDKLKQQINTGS